MKSIHIKLIAVFMLIFGLQACTNEFEEINDNPNFPTVDEANPALILPKILFETGNHMTARIGWNLGNIIAQLVATNNFTGTDRYLLGTYESTWNLMYRNMRDANNLEALGESINNPAYQGAAITLRAWMLAQLTEMWGDVPYTEALQGKNNEFLPKYDAQEDLYPIILADLERAAGLSAEGGSMSGDILFDGDNLKWQRLANSLRLRYLMRLENKWGDLGINGAQEMQAIVNSGIIFTGNEDNAAVPYLAGTNRWPLNTARVGSFDEKRMSQTIETVLKDLNDPRMPILFRQVDNPSSTDFVGVPNGLSEDAASNFNGGANNQSRLGTRFREEPAAVEMVIMHYSELQFILAEAAQKGYISGDAAFYYQNGINGNMNYLGITETAAYLAEANVALTTNELERIATQKWLSLFMVGNEAWFDYRRTGLPVLSPGPNAVLNQLPVRIQYPGSEQVLNGGSYQAAVSSQGADENTTMMWLLQ
ncbi:MAG: SusD/RagB family nutrient-binding outer membrane lipoprotein [Bacteroidota bacterium]